MCFRLECHIHMCVFVFDCANAVLTMGCVSFNQVSNFLMLCRPALIGLDAFNVFYLNPFRSSHNPAMTKHLSMM